MQIMQVCKVYTFAKFYLDILEDYIILAVFVEAFVNSKTVRSRFLGADIFGSYHASAA